MKLLRPIDLYTKYPTIKIAWRIFIRVPVSNCSAEPSFSCLWWVKNYLRSTNWVRKLLQRLDLKIKFENEKTRRVFFMKICFFITVYGSWNKFRAYNSDNCYINNKYFCKNIFQTDQPADISMINGIWKGFLKHKKMGEYQILILLEIWMLFKRKIN